MTAGGNRLGKGSGRAAEQGGELIQRGCLLRFEWRHLGTQSLQLGAGAGHINFVATTTFEQTLGNIQLSQLNRQ